MWPLHQLKLVPYPVVLKSSIQHRRKSWESIQYQFESVAVTDYRTF